MNNYYIYIYLDPRKPGKYTYKDISFVFEPIYIGKGIKNRFKSHLTRATNSIFKNKLINISNKKLTPFILFFKTGLEETAAFELEKNLINQIGRIIEDTGPLCNFTEGGDCGPTSKGQANPASKTNMTEAKRKAKGKKAYITRLATGQVKKGNAHNFSSEFLTKDQLLAKTAKSVETRKKSGIFENSRLKMQAAKKAKAPKITLVSPYGIEYFINFDLNPFCKEHNLSYNMIWTRLNKEQFGIIVANKQHKSQTQLNTVGWEIKKL